MALAVARSGETELTWWYEATLFKPSKATNQCWPDELTIGGRDQGHIIRRADRRMSADAQELPAPIDSALFGDEMKIGIMGAGNMGAAFAHRLATADHEVAIAARELDEARKVANEVGHRVRAVPREEL